MTNKTEFTGCRIEEDIYKQFKAKHPEVSHRIRQLIHADLSNGGHDTPTINRNDIVGLMDIIYQDARPIQLIGDVGIGKSDTMKRLIESDRTHTYIVLDCHDEYRLPVIQTITDDLKQSCRIKLPEQISASKGLFQVYHNELLSHRRPDNYVVVVEEAHRYAEVRELLKEARKFVKVIAICQERLGDFCPGVKVIA
ncbi:MAG: AAA family ATPase [Candidatus Aenigmatarchaeota archaeon]